MSTLPHPRRWCALTLLLLVAACQDRSAPTAPKPGSPQKIIVDGAHSGGNPNVFFLAPLVLDPSHAPGFAATPFQPGLPVAFKICEVVNGAGCKPDNSNLVRYFPTSAVKMWLGGDEDDKDYHVFWNTRADNLSPAKIYRLEVWIGAKAVAYADVRVLSNGSQILDVLSGRYIGVLPGLPLAIRVRVQQGWDCQNQTSCATQVVSNTPPAGQQYTVVTTNDGENAAAFPANWFDPTVAGTDQVVVTIQDVTQQLNPNGGTAACAVTPTTMLTPGGHCVRFTTNPRVTFTNTVVVAVCRIGNPADKRQLLMKYDVNETPTFLRNVAPPIVCPEITPVPSRSGVFGKLSSAVSRLGGILGRVFGPRTAYAIDVGVGGAIDAGGGFSVVASGLPVTMSAVGGDGQSAAAGATLATPVRVMLTTPHPNPAPLVGATVTCTIASGGGSLGGAASGTAVTDANGIATCPSWTLGQTPGSNTLRVTAANVDPVVYMGTSPMTASPGALTFTAAATSGNTISGAIYYSTTPLAGIRVEMGDGIDFRAQPRQSVTTGPEGHYAFTNVPGGTHWVNVLGGGVYSDTVTLIIGVDGADIVRDIDLPRKLYLQTPPDGDIVDVSGPLFTWSANPDARMYHIGIQANNQLVVNDSGPAASYSLASPLTAGLSYGWQVSAFDGARHWVGAYVRMFSFTAMHADQVADPSTETTYSLATGTTGQMFQSFTPAASSISAVKMRVRAGGSFPAAGQTLTLRIRAGSPSGDVIGSVPAFVAGPRAVGESFYIVYRFGTPITVTPGATYVLDWDATGGEILSWYSSAVPYTGGSAILGGQPQQGLSFDFLTYWY